ncbi:KPN_02809 family neutral zinc metallopeptidase [Labedella endophytica]|uniref:Neutral zinc metallopeptidase n=1 Tax=Labedella endophytica TaxID=1523160 RepID=A0A3S0VIW7_9MICO|nr:neutral zinc metallopeptidase [Labedella endophytica]RUR03664.1 neutral zinc metallopeptidase [Labedella endophytica]
MTFNEGADIRGGKVRRRRGRTAGVAAGGGGLVVLAVFLIGQFTGVDVSGLLGGGTSGGGQASDTALTQCETGADANEQLDCRMQAAATSLDDYWASEVDGYPQPELILFEGAVDTGCGSATSAVGPFYCPPDQTVYIDTSFFEDLRTRFGSSGGSLAQLYVVAHEWGHHIQNVTGAMDGLDTSQAGPESDGVRLELQADCYAGAWVRAAQETTDADGDVFLEPVTSAQLADALSAAEAVGDDRIQESAGGGVNPETWTHGASEQRQEWFTTGLENGPGSCDTFSASTL